MDITKKNSILWILTTILILGNIAAASYIFSTAKKLKQEKNNLKEIVQLTENLKSESEEKQAADEAKIEEEEKENKEEETEELKDFEPQGERIVSASSEITITWSYSKEYIKSGEIFNDNRFKKIAKEYEEKYKENDREIFECDMHKVGTVSNGTYSNDEVYLMTCGMPGMGSVYGPEYITIKDGDDLIILANYSDEKIDYLKNYTIINKGAVLTTNDNIPDSIKIPGSDVNLIKGEESKVWGSVFTRTDVKPLFSYDGENYVYIGNNNCYYIEVGDSNKIQYNIPKEYFTLDFINENDEKNEEKYEYTKVGGCGMMDCYNFSTTTKDMLKKIGTTSNGLEIFKAKDSQEMNEKYNYIYTKEYYPYGEAKLPYDEYLESNPLLYVEDPFGNIVELKNEKYKLAVECGKPVIYLYPEKEINARVFVEPNGGFTITEPAYNKKEGWYVNAKPNGNLYNYRNNTSYDYLFWEGHGFNYVRPEKGFIVAKNDVKQFFEEKLAKLGLIKKEADEFIEFWLPKMQEKNYYFITFMPKEDFDKLAPLNVIPRPDTVIRVFMDFEGMDEKIEVTEQEIITPERNGFTVVEWGGALH